MPHAILPNNHRGGNISLKNKVSNQRGAKSMTISSVRELNIRVKEEAIILQDLLAEINKVMVDQVALVEVC